MKRLTIAFLWLTLAFCGSAQAQQQEDEKPKTQLEAFAAKTGVVIIRGFSEVGTLKGQYGTSVTVEAREFTNAQNGQKEYGIAVKVTGGRDQDNTSYVDYEEIESLVQGLDYISKIDRAVTAMENFQADYRTQGDLVLSTYTSGGKIEFSVSSGRIGRQLAFLSLGDATKMRELVVQAKQRIDSMK